MGWLKPIGFNTLCLGRYYKAAVAYTPMHDHEQTILSVKHINILLVRAII